MQLKSNNTKKGGKLAGLRGAGAKSKMGQCRRKKDWPGVVKHGLEMLKLNPWESSVLSEIAAALAELGFDECRLEYLKLALLAAPTDVEMNKQAALAFEDVADFDNAIRCWERISQQRPTDEEARRTINHLAVQKTIHKGNYEEAESSRDASVQRNTASTGPED